MAKEKLELSAIQDAIASSNAGWEAGVTSVSELSDAEKKHRLGYTPGPDAPSLEDQEQICSNALTQYLSDSAMKSADTFAAPASLDWRNNGGNFVTDVKNQGNCGSCVAFGTIASIESQIKILRGATYAIDLSEAHLFYCHARSESRNCRNGWWPDRALNFFQSQGVTEEAYYPYTAGDQNCSGKLAGWDTHLTKITGYSKINGIEAIKEFVSTKGPVEACFSVYNDFFSYRSGIYRHTTGTLAGGHCVCIVGYDTAGGYWICKNSWGTGFGESGFFKIAFGQCGIEGQVYGATGIVNNYNINGVKVQGLWATNETRNAWVYLSGGNGWKKIGNSNDTAFLNMLTQLASAKTTNSNVNVIIKDSFIQQVYVF
ncbi:MAG: C1 family peptidase [Saprospiraceae bacterium]|nr:C1 family peptidase [Candidatus Defluviibacterium haderslevense]